MSRNIYCNPRLLIDGREVKSLISASFSDAGNNQISSLSAKFSEPDLENSSLFNKKIEYYLNYGSDDSYPLFRGYIKNYNATDIGFAIKALDVRTLISGKDSFPVVIDNKKNYDGQTIIQFLIDVIENELDLDEGLSTSATNDMDKPIYMTGYRGRKPVYDVLTTSLKNYIDSDDILLPQSYFIDVINEGMDSSIVIKKNIDVNTRTDMVLSYFDGIKTLKYIKRASPSFALAETVGGEQVKFQYGNAPSGKLGFVINKKYSSRGEAHEALIPHVISRQGSEIDIILTTSKGHYLSIGNIISLNVKDNNIQGSFRVTSKNINYGKEGLQCTLRLNKVPNKLSDYIN
tara:strand:- start:186 stop:1223 length:1038 start_codon:yes stop_codon:yes gene_type:complete